MSEKMTFKGLQLEIGDFVTFRTSTVPLLEVQATVIDVKDGVLEVMSTLLALFRHGGKFTADDVQDIMVVYPAEIAIPQESGGKNFRKGECVNVTAKNGEGALVPFSGEVVAAFDGFVVARIKDGRLITGRASHFNAVA